MSDENKTTPPAANAAGCSVDPVVSWPGWLALAAWIAVGVIGKLLEGKDVPWITYLSQCWGATIFLIGINLWRARPANNEISGAKAAPKA